MSIFYFDRRGQNMELGHMEAYEGQPLSTQYLVQYKVTAGRRGGFFCGMEKLFPKLSIRYCKDGPKRWIYLGEQEIDEYTFDRFRHNYYEEFPSYFDSPAVLGSDFDYRRLTIFMEILEKEFGGSIAKLVEHIVRGELALGKADKEEREEANRITRSLVTNGWRTMNIKV